MYLVVSAQFHECFGMLFGRCLGMVGFGLDLSKLSGYRYRIFDLGSEISSISVMTW